jgi:aspartate carbamoyltransferase catalytic subunit
MTYVSVESRSKLARSTPAKFPLRGRAGPLKHVLSAKAIDSDAVDDYCRLADAFEARSLSAPEAVGKTVALLFFQPSTRTRLGFESATVALGAHTIGMEDMSGSRTRAHGRTQESLEDCAAVVSRLCDAIVVRHYETGAAARMAAKSATPVINAGDGWNEHPTQALIDIYALRRGLGSIRGRSIAIGGDPRGRTVRSLIHLLRFEAPGEIVFCPPAHIPVPADVLSAITENQVRYRMVGDIEGTLTDCDAIMMAPYDMSEIGEPAAAGYVPPNQTPDSHIITPEKIERTGSQTLLYHPLPRLEEVHPACDVLPNAMYFEQVRLSKFMRMAVLHRVLSAS